MAGHYPTPEWLATLAPGLGVAIYSSSGWSETVEIAMVARLTRTQVVVGSDHRQQHFWCKDGMRVSAGSSARLLPIEHPAIIRQQRLEAFTEAQNELDRVFEQTKRERPLTRDAIVKALQEASCVIDRALFHCNTLDDLEGLREDGKAQDDTPGEGSDAQQ